MAPAAGTSTRPGIGPRAPLHFVRGSDSFVVSTQHSAFGLHAVWVGAELRLVEARDVFASAGDRVDALAVLVCDLDVRGDEVVLELFHGARADDRAGDAG